MAATNFIIKRAKIKVSKFKKQSNISTKTKQYIVKLTKDEPRVVIDLEYERQQQSYKMNDAVKSFITHFYRAIQNAKIFEITHDYEYG